MADKDEATGVAANQPNQGYDARILVNSRKNHQTILTMRIYYMKHSSSSMMSTK